MAEPPSESFLVDRFSEDLDFRWKRKNGFDLTSYFPVLEKEVKSFGLNMDIQEAEKQKKVNPFRIS